MAIWNFAIIGCGNVAHFHAQAIQAMPNAKLLAVYGRDQAKAKQFAAKYNCDAYHDLEQMTQLPELQIVTITTPSGAHLEPCRVAAQAGKHIICEKPVEVTTDRIKNIITVCQENNVLFSGIFNRRFFPTVAYLKQAVEKNRFGRISLCEAQIKWFRTQAYYDSGEWRGTKALDGGGALMNQGIHTIDLLLYVMGPVKRLTASTACLTHQSIEVEDTAVAILEFQNGARGVIQGSTSCWSSTGHPAEVHICGDQGSVFMTDDHFRVWDFMEAHPDDELVKREHMSSQKGAMGANDPTAMDYEGHQLNFENVIAALEGQAELLVTGEESMKAVNLIQAIYESAADHGRWIEFV